MDRDIASAGQIVVGRVLAARGLKGEVKVEVISDSPDRFSSGGIVFVEGKPYTIQRSSWLPKGTLALKLKGIGSRGQAEGLRDSLLTVPEEMVPPPPEGQYYHFQIIDMRVHTQEREYLGQVTQIISTGSNDVYVVSSGEKEILIPALDDVIKEMDVERGMMTVDLPEGLRPSP